MTSLAGYFPVVVRTGPNALAAVFRTGAPHIGALGTVAVSTSADGGKSWSDPVEVVPRGDDSRNPAVGVNAEGELVVSFWKAALHCYGERSEGFVWIDDAEQEKWATTPALFTCRSADGGRTWTEPAPYASTLLTLASPYGRMLTAPDGSLLMSVYGRTRGESRGDTAILARSRDGGRTWGGETAVARGYNETAYAFLPNGDLVGATRSEGGHVAVLFSSDQGRSWSDPVQVTRNGEHPADLTLLQSGRLLLTFGRRIRPMGCGALISEDGGRTWDTTRELLLAGDGVAGPDLGYPSTVQLADGTLVTLLYYATGSDLSSTDWAGGGMLHDWGAVSCQAIHWREDEVFG